MLKIEGPDPSVLTRKLRHHAEEVRPLINALVYALVFESSYARDDDVHLIRQSRTGPGSFALVLASGDEYHFRLSGVNRKWIDVRDSYQDSKVIRTIRSEDEARQFVRKLSKKSKPLVATP